MTFVLDRLRLPHAVMCDVVVVALTAERIPAALRTAVRTNRCSVVGALRDGRLAARHADVTGYVFDQR